MLSSKLRVDPQELIAMLDELEDPGSPRHQAAAVVIEAAMDGGLLPSPFYKGRSMFESFFAPLCIRLGIATRVCEVAYELDPRLPSYGFDQETKVAFEHWDRRGILAGVDLPAERIWYEQVIPRAVLFGYDATTA